MELSEATATPRTERAWHVALLLFLPILVYANSLHGAYHLDDIYRVRDNPEVEQVWPPWRHFVDPGTSATLPHLVQYRPLLPLSLSLNRAASDALGLDPLVGFHLGNLLIHLIGVLLLYALFAELIGHWSGARHTPRSAGRLALAGALLYSLHPVAGVSVNYICGRDLLLMLAFLVASLLVYARWRRLGSGRTRWPLCLLLLLLSLCSKTNALVAPLIVLAFEWTCGGARCTSPRALLRALPFAATVGAYLFITRFVLGFSDAEKLIVESPGTFWLVSVFTEFEYPLTQLRLHLFHYLRNVFWPFSLRAEASITPATWTDPGVWAGAALVAGSLGWAALRRRRRPLAAFCVAAYWILPLLTSSVLPLRRLATDYRLIPSLAFLCLLLALAGARLFAGRWRVAALVGAAAWFGGTTAFLNGHWRTEETFWHQSIRHGGSALAHMNYGLAVVGRDPELAEFHYRRALELYPGHVYARINLGLLMIRGERQEEGLDLVREAADLMPDWGLTHHWLAVAYELLDDLDSAAGSAVRATECDGRNAAYARESARLLFAAGFRAQKAGRLGRAIGHYERHLLLEPAAAQSHFNLAHALMETGEFARAIEHFERALELRPDYGEVHLHLATCLGALGDEPARAREQALCERDR